MAAIRMLPSRLSPLHRHALLGDGVTVAMGDPPRALFAAVHLGSPQGIGARLAVDGRRGVLKASRLGHVADHVVRQELDGIRGAVGEARGRAAAAAERRTPGRQPPPAGRSGWQPNQDRECRTLRGTRRRGFRWAASAPPCRPSQTRPRRCGGIGIRGGPRPLPAPGDLAQRAARQSARRRTRTNRKGSLRCGGAQRALRAGLVSAAVGVSCRGGRPSGAAGRSTCAGDVGALRGRDPLGDLLAGEAIGEVAELRHGAGSSRLRWHQHRRGIHRPGIRRQATRRSVGLLAAGTFMRRGGAVRPRAAPSARMRLQRRLPGC